MENNIKKGSFVAISDFHSYEWPLEKIEKYYLNEYENIMILGDATDRGPYQDGTNGLSILLEIQKLTKQYPNRVHYIPGNHDSFLYDFMCALDDKRIDIEDIKESISSNGGEQTIKDVEVLYNKDRNTFNILKKWLSSRPLQKKLTYNGKTYCFAHAFFDNDIYQEYPNFSLKDLREINNDKVNRIIWFRKDCNGYYPDYEPSSILPNSTMVIGHTPIQSRKDMNMDLMDADRNEAKVVCIDGGIFKTQNTMLKYDGIPHKGIDSPIETLENSHKNTSLDDSISLKELISKINSILKKSLNIDIKEIRKSGNNKIKFEENKVNDATLELKNSLGPKAARIIEYIKNKNQQIDPDRLLKILIVALIISIGGYIASDRYESKKDEKPSYTSEYSDLINYKIQSGDYLEKIAAKYHTSVSVILELNPQITNPDKIQVGSSIVICPGVYSLEETTKSKRLF